jgi:hypothetical protein
MVRRKRWICWRRRRIRN